MTPIRNPQDEGEVRFNAHHRRARQKIEATFERWKMRWLCLHRDGGAIYRTPDRCCKVIIACAVLHNICEEHGLPIPEDVRVNDDNPDEDVNPPIMPDDVNGERVRAGIVRDHFWA
ncbi:putative nuclease HARBI1 [Lineus longissimus]|uniref:putative nuclease HARBI1 n=1 Tax=Lineus longissimus TaxID=88925 RepID=UPI00315C7FDB